jgi:hypothetical protein
MEELDISRVELQISREIQISREELKGLPPQRLSPRRQRLLGFVTPREVQRGGRRPW